MDYLIRAEQRYQEHCDHVAQVDAEGWKRVRVGGRPLATVVARALVTLAVRLDKTVATQARPTRVRTAATAM
jgi:hypothetical protein